MKYLFVISTIFIAIVSFGQTDTIPRPLDPYPIWGCLYEFEPDSENVNIDTIFISGCQVQILVDTKVIATGLTNSFGRYKIEFPVELFIDHDIFVKTNCEDYNNLESGPKVLNGTFYPAMGMHSNFGLERKEN